MSTNFTPPAPTRRTNTSRNVLRAFEIFELLKDCGEERGIADIATHLKIPRSTAYELVRTLVEARYLEKRSNASLGLGRKLHELGAAYRGQSPLLENGVKIVRDLRDDVRETVQLSVLDENLMLVVLKEEGLQPVRIISKVGTRVPCNWAAAGKVLLAYKSVTEARAILAATIRPSPTGKAITNVDTLMATLGRVRRNGYATEIGEVNAHGACVAAPVFDKAHFCVAALSIAVPRQRVVDSDRELLVRSVKKSAATLSACLP